MRAVRRRQTAERLRNAWALAALRRSLAAAEELAAVSRVDVESLLRRALDGINPEDDADDEAPEMETEL